MIDTTFDPAKIVETWRNAFAPALKTQQEGLKAIDRLSRYNYAVAGDCLEFGLAHAKASLAATTPAEFAGSQTTLATQFGEKIKSRIQELATLTAEAQTAFNVLFGEATAKVADTIKAKVAEAGVKTAEATKKAA